MQGIRLQLSEKSQGHLASDPWGGQWLLERHQQIKWDIFCSNISWTQITFQLVSYGADPSWYNKGFFSSSQGHDVEEQTWGRKSVHVFWEIIVALYWFVPEKERHWAKYTMFSARVARQPGNEGKMVDRLNSPDDGWVCELRCQSRVIKLSSMDTPPQSIRGPWGLRVAEWVLWLG